MLERAYRAISAATVSGPALMIKIINCGGGAAFSVGISGDEAQASYLDDPQTAIL